MDKDKKLIKETIIEMLASRTVVPKGADFYRMTESRLYAYPVLLENIKRYKLDIEDLKREKVTEKSKDITCWGGGSGVRLTPEEKQQGKILAVEIKMARDQAEVDIIDKAMQRLDMTDIELIDAIYMGAVSVEDVATNEGLSVATINRMRSRIVRKLAIMLYGAEALG